MPDFELSPKEMSACSIFARWHFGNARSRTKNKRSPEEVFEAFQKIYKTLSPTAKGVIDCIRAKNDDYLEVKNHLKEWERQLPKRNVPIVNT